MPIYCFRCPKCGQREESLRRFSQSDDPKDCPACGAAMLRDLRAEVPAKPAGFETIWSEALGVHPSQVAEHRRVHPDIPIRDDGCVGISSYRENVRICKKLGFDPK